MALKNPTPPTPPTPPSMDKGDGENNHAKIDAKQLLGIHKENSAENISEGDENFSEEVEENSPPQVVGKREVTTPETMARDVVANGGGPLTKRTVEKPQEKNSQDNSQTQQKNSLPPSLNFAMTEDDKGKEVLKQFQRDENISTEQKNSSTTETPRVVKLNLNEGHGGIYWAFALTFAIILAVVFVKKFLVTDKPKLKKSDLFEDSNKKLKNVSEKISKPAKNYQPSKPVQPIKNIKQKISKSDDDDKGKHFEVRV